MRPTTSPMLGARLRFAPTWGLVVVGVVVERRGWWWGAAAVGRADELGVLRRSWLCACYSCRPVPHSW